MFFIYQFVQKTKPLYQNHKYLFGIRILIWAAKNQGFNHCVSVVRVYTRNSFGTNREKLETKNATEKSEHENIDETEKKARLNVKK